MSMKERSNSVCSDGDLIEVDEELTFPTYRHPTPGNYGRRDHSTEKFEGREAEGDRPYCQGALLLGQQQ